MVYDFKNITKIISFWMRDRYVTIIFIIACSMLLYCNGLIIHVIPTLNEVVHLISVCLPYIIPCSEVLFFTENSKSLLSL